MENIGYPNKQHKKNCLSICIPKMKRVNTVLPPLTQYAGVNCANKPNKIQRLLTIVIHK